MKKKSSKLAAVYVTVLMFVNVFSLVGCGKTENTGLQAEQELQLEIPETNQEARSVHTDEKVQTSAIDITQTQAGERREGVGSIIREYSDTEKERMQKLQQSYQNETEKPEKKIQEVDSAENVTEGTPCYITSTGEYYLPDRELTDEELLEIIDCSFRIALGTNTKTQAEWDEIARKERAAFEERVKAADGISEEEAVEIAQKAMEDDIGVKAKKLELTIDETFGWKSDLCIADWGEIKEKDRGALAYYINFNNGEKVADFKELINYNCVVNAVDGSILEAYESQGLDGSIIYYEH
ncbi:MAG: hypothetical protein NC400_09430 [Clostridium sp.]|nr:hypothetical protein [Clostridium sp.]